MGDASFELPATRGHAMFVRFTAVSVIVVASAAVLRATDPPEDGLSMAYYTACQDVRAGKDLKSVREALWRAIITHPDSYCLRHARQLDEDLAEAIRHPPRADAPPAKRLALTRFVFTGRVSLDKPKAIPDEWRTRYADDPVVLLLRRDRSVIGELAPALGDRSPTRSEIGAIASGEIDAIPRVCDVALALVEAHSGCRFWPRDEHLLFHQTPADVQKQCAERVEEWWREYKDKPPADGIRSQLPFAASYHDTIAMAQNLMTTAGPNSKGREYGAKLLLDMSRRHHNHVLATEAAAALIQAGDRSALDLFYEERQAHLGRPGLPLHPYVTRYQCQYGGRREWELLYQLAASPAQPGEDLARDVLDSLCAHRTHYAIPLLSFALSVTKHPDVPGQAVACLEKLTGKSFGTGPAAVERAKRWWLSEGKAVYTFDAIETKYKPQPVTPAPRP